MNLIDALEIKDVHLVPNGYKAKMKLGVFHEQPYGTINGGATIAFAEITAGYASNLLGEGAYYAVGQSVTAHHMKPMKAKDYLYATAELMHSGHRSHVWNIKMKDKEDNLISMVTVTNSLIYRN